MSEKGKRKDVQTISRRKVIAKGARAAGLGVLGSVSGFHVNHAWSRDVVWDGQPFDAGGATIRINEWGGFWKEHMRTNLLDAFEKDYNCKVAYDSSFPWFPKYIASGPKDPAFHVGNWNLNEIIKLGRIGDFFLDVNEIRESVPNAADCWDFAFGSGLGVTWGFGELAYVWRTDLIDEPPTGFRSFWDERFAGKRGTYITSNTLQQIFFMLASEVWGTGQRDMDAGLDAMKRVMPIKISDFTGNMQTLVERGEVEIGVQWEGEIFLQIDKGIKVAPLNWEERQPILSQTKTIARYADPVTKKLALALLHHSLGPAFQRTTAEVFYLRPSNKKAELPQKLANKGVKNSEDAMQGLWIPDWNWYLDNEDEIVETVNEIFSR